MYFTTTKILSCCKWLEIKKKKNKKKKAKFCWFWVHYTKMLTGHLQLTQVFRSSCMVRLDKQKKQGKPYNAKSPATGPSIKQMWVHNLSFKTLSNYQQKPLEKGLKFTVTPNHMPTFDFVSGAEFGLRQVTDAAKVAMARSIVQKFKNRPKFPKATFPMKKI